MKYQYSISKINHKIMFGSGVYSSFWSYLRTYSIIRIASLIIIYYVANYTNNYYLHVTNGILLAITIIVGCNMTIDYMLTPKRKFVIYFHKNIFVNIHCVTTILAVLYALVYKIIIH